MLIGGGVLIAIGIISLVLYFILSPKKIMISFDTKGGNEIKEMEVEKGKKVTLPVPKREGYVFDGWWDDTKKVDNEESFEKNMKLVAHWKQKKICKIMFDSNGGSKVDDLIYQKEPVNFPKPKREGYTFIGWEDKNGMVLTDGVLLECEVFSLKAKWSK